MSAAEAFNLDMLMGGAIVAVAFLVGKWLELGIYE